MINDCWIFYYDMHQINIELINHKKVRKSWNIEFHAVNMWEYDMILDVRNQHRASHMSVI